MKNFALLTSVLFSSTLFAQEIETPPKPATYWQWGADVSVASINSKTAKQEGVDKNAYLLGVNANYISSNWVTSLGMDMVFYDDKSDFKQYVEGDGLFNRGDVSVESSSASGLLLSVATGYQWLYGKQQQIALRLQGGASVMAMSERSISGCSNCYSEDIDVDGGIFAKVTALHQGEHINIGAHLQQYAGDGLGTVFGITVSTSF